MRWGVRWGLSAALGGLIAYVIYIMVASPGSDRWIQHEGVLGLAMAVIGGSLTGWAGGWLWQRQIEMRGSKRPVR